MQVGTVLTCTGACTFPAGKDDTGGARKAGATREPFADIALGRLHIPLRRYATLGGKPPVAQRTSARSR
ncbi:hypothetical protein GCM10011578_100080 [Streptomyces fuscichromogenes]|uniref:Uncharacterized protein n=1 Tax=Streptomyces fuscichromogenes TaxID=1324013 RepID=A0A917XPK5_9ACTN|nr:hypothetical protein GCM10011578_100080 [Streptomyces fuscichromogenes]